MMKRKTVFAILSWLLVPAFLTGRAQAQAAAAPCVPVAQPAQPAAQVGGGRGPGARDRRSRGNAARPRNRLRAT